MRYKLFLALILLLSFQSCNDNNQSKGHTSVGSALPNSKVPNNIDEDFNVFLEYFSNDSLFQISRVDFPLKVEEYDVTNDKELKKIIEKSDYRKHDFSKRELKNNLNNYTQEIKAEQNKATIEIRGIENGLIIDFVFEKKNGKWKLITWTDSST